MSSDASHHTNSGAAVRDVEAVGADHIAQATWLQKQNIDAGARIRLAKLSHMRYQHPDLDEITKFMLDFGMNPVKRTDNEVWFQGYGADNYVYYATKGDKKFLGGAFEVQTREDLEKASKIAGASEIQELKTAPGGGYMVTVPDPEGFVLHLVFGQEQVKPSSGPDVLPLNYGMEKPRVRKFQRFKSGPAAVHKLGHFGLCTTKYEEMLSFYTQNFNIVPSDFIYVPAEDGTKQVITCFAHLDLGDTPVDHHSFFLSANPTTHVHHCSFEVHDFDTQHLGHQWLAEKGYESVWGIGRHVLGSQIFDYWWDISGNMVEHYADGDLVNAQTPIAYVQAGHESLAVWGPELPPTFLA